MTWISRYRQKKLISKISVDSNFTFSSYAWLCMFHCSHWLLCWIKSRVQELSVKIALISYWNGFSLIPLSVLLRELRKYAKNSNFDNFENALYLTSGSSSNWSWIHIPNEWVIKGELHPKPKLSMLFQIINTLNSITQSIVKGGRMGRSDKVSLWCVSLLINTRIPLFILE